MNEQRKTAKTRYKIKVVRHLPYVADKKVGRRKLDLYLPRTEKKGPLLLYIHGGAWIAGDKRSSAHIGKALARKGIATAIINYRLAAPDKDGHPAATLDGAAAFAWLAQQTIDGLAGNAPVVTGAAGLRVLGGIFPGS